MSYDINSQQVDIENLFKQNANDLSSIKELYRKLEKLEEKITQIKYIDSKLADKLKKDYEKLKRIILDENIQAELNNKIEDTKTEIKSAKTEINEINAQLDNKIDEVNSQLDTKAKQTDLEVERKRIDSFTTLPQGSTVGDAELIDGRVGSDGRTYTNIGGAVRSKVSELDVAKSLLFNDSFQNIYKIYGNCLESDSTVTHHLNTCISCDITNISAITSIEINYDIAFSNSKPYYFSTKYRTTGGSLIEVNNINNISEWNRFNNINI